MGLSKLSEKCNKCKKKDVCDNKRMETCAYIVPEFAAGGLVSPEIAFGGITKEASCIVSPSFRVSDSIIEEIHRAMAKSMRRCAFEGVIP